MTDLKINFYCLVKEHPYITAKVKIANEMLNEINLISGGFSASADARDDQFVSFINMVISNLDLKACTGEDLSNIIEKTANKVKTQFNFNKLLYDIQFIREHSPISNESSDQPITVESMDGKQEI